MLADQNDSATTLPDNLLALPLWAAVSALGLLGAGVAVGFIFLLTPGLGDAERSSGSELLLISLPVLALAIGLIGASWARTERIDRMAATFLHGTVGNKLEAYLVGPNRESKVSIRFHRYLNESRDWPDRVLPTVLRSARRVHISTQREVLRP